MNSPPRQMLRKNMNASRYEWANCCRNDGTPAPMRPKTAPAAIRYVGTFLHLGSIAAVIGDDVAVAPIRLFRSRRGRWQWPGQRGALGSRHVLQRGQPAALKSADVGDDGPAIRNRQVRGVALHESLAVADGVEQFAIGLLRYPAGGDVVQVADDGHAEFRGDALAIARFAVARGATDVESLASAGHELRGDGQRNRIHPVGCAGDLAGVLGRILVRSATGDGAGHGQL